MATNNGQSDWNDIIEPGGSVENVDVWGKRRLAYDILKRSEGIYVVIDMTTTPEVALEINRRMGIDETILRTKLLRPDAH